MRANPNLYPGVNSSIQASELSLQTALNQLSSGKRVALPSDDPLAFATDLRSVADSANVDQYTRNADAVVSQAQMADSALSSVTASLTKALSIGTQGANGTVSSGQRAALAQQVQGILSDVVSQANLNTNGHALFAGTASTTTPFVADASAPDGFTYQGNSDSNTTQVGEGLEVPVNIPGDAIFTSSSGNVLGSLQAVVSALNSGSPSDMANASAAVSAAIAHISQVRAQYGGTVNQLQAQTDYLSQETVSLSSQQTSLTDVDTATAATNLTQAETAHSAVLAMAAKLLPVSLLNYLQ